MAQIVDGPTPAERRAATPAAPAASVTAPPAPPAPPITAPDRAAPDRAVPDTAPRRTLRRPASRPQQRRTRVTVRRVGPLSVLKFSLIFYFCVMLAVFLGFVFLFMILQAVGVIDSVEEWITKIFPQDGGGTFEIAPGYLLPRLFLVGCGMVVVWSLINLMVAFLYNLISDIVGGVEITLAEKR